MSERPTMLCLEPFQVRRLRALALRLFREERMDGDEMRNGAQLIESVLRTAMVYSPEEEGE